MAFEPRRCQRGVFIGHLAAADRATNNIGEQFEVE